MRACLSAASLWILLFQIAISQEQLITFTGDSLDETGAAVASAGDVDADGVEDILVGAPFAFAGDAGKVTVLSGASSAVLYSLSAGGPQGHFGSAVVGVGDVDQDGHADFAISAPDVGADFGLVNVYSGATGTVLYSFTGSAADDRLGHSLAAADINLDGTLDILAGGRSHVFTSDVKGYVRAFSGATGAVLLTDHGPAGGATYGWSVANAGDIDGDGHPEFAVGAPQLIDTSPPVSIGQVRIVSGNTGTPLRTIKSQPFVVAFLGFSVAGGRDLNQDGIPDVVASAIKPSNPFPNDTSSIGAWSGMDGSLLWITPSAQEHERFGTSVAMTDDVDGDGVSDVLAGSPLDNQPTKDSGSVRFLSGASGGPVSFVPGLIAGRRLGTSVAPLGDINGDGRQDYVVGSPSENFVTPPGATVYAGAPGMVTHYGDPCYQTATQDHWGTLNLAGTTSPGETVQIVLHRPGATQSILLLGGLTSTNLPIKASCSLLLDPMFMIVINPCFPSGCVQSLTIPPSATPGKLYLQAFFVSSIFFPAIPGMFGSDGLAVEIH